MLLQRQRYLSREETVSPNTPQHPNILPSLPIVPPTAPSSSQLTPAPFNIHNNYNFTPLSGESFNNNNNNNSFLPSPIAHYPTVYNQSNQPPLLVRIIDDNKNNKHNKNNNSPPQRLIDRFTYEPTLEQQISDSKEQRLHIYFKPMSWLKNLCSGGSSCLCISKVFLIGLVLYIILATIIALSENDSRAHHGRKRNVGSFIPGFGGSSVEDPRIYNFKLECFEKESESSVLLRCGSERIDIWGIGQLKITEDESDHSEHKENDDEEDDDEDDNNHDKDKQEGGGSKKDMKRYVACAKAFLYGEDAREASALTLHGSLAYTLIPEAPSLIHIPLQADMFDSTKSKGCIKFRDEALVDMLDDELMPFYVSVHLDSSNSVSDNSHIEHRREFRAYVLIRNDA